MRCLVLVILLGICVGLEAAEPVATSTASRDSFIATYCFECHDTATSKAGLSLELLPRRWDAPAAVKDWVRVHDRVAAGDMPPSGKKQPSAEERQRWISTLGDELRTVTRQRQQREGRVTLRRLNRLELETTFSDLLQTPVELGDLLPDDLTFEGFDTVSTGLEISSEHWVRYQRAADRAIAAALAWRRSVPEKRRFTGKQWYAQQLALARRSSEWKLTGSARCVGDSVWVYAQTREHPHLEFNAGQPGGPGRYRVRASLTARNTHGEPIPVLFFLPNYDVYLDITQQHILGVREALPDKTSILDFTFEVPFASERFAGQSVCVRGWDLPVQPAVGAFEAREAIGEKPDWTAAALAMDWVEWEGPLEISPGTGYRRLFGDLAVQVLPTGSSLTPVAPSNPERVGDRLLRDFLPRAFRRSASEEEVKGYVSVFRDALGRGNTFEASMRIMYRAVLCSPHFLFRVEAPGPLGDDAIASRLSFFLWSSCPDDALVSVARSGGLRDPRILHETVERMLTDTRSRRFARSFAGQWLDVRRLYETKPDLMYGEFDDALLWSMGEETYLFFEEILKHNQGVDQFVASDWSMLNHRLAQHYAIPGVHSWIHSVTSLPTNSHRGGVLTQASIMKVTANGTSTSPVRRGSWVLSKLLGKPPAPPPPGVGSIEPDIRGAVTVREQLAKHRTQEQCNRCHRFIDPPGFALENFDVIGGWRDWYRVKGIAERRGRLPNYPHLTVSRGSNVEQGGLTPDGRAFLNIDDYRAILLGDREQVARHLIELMVTYATGAVPEFADREVVEEILRKTMSTQHGLRSIVHEVVQSRLFLEK